MMDAFEYLILGLIICYLALFLIGTMIGGFIGIGLFLFPEMTSLHIEKITNLGERLNKRYNNLELDSESILLEAPE